MEYDDLSPRGRAFIDAYHRGDPDAMDRLVREQVEEEFLADVARHTRPIRRIAFVLFCAGLVFFALAFSRWIEL